jgi:hypothetical protein
MIDVNVVNNQLRIFRGTMESGTNYLMDGYIACEVHISVVSPLRPEGPNVIPFTETAIIFWKAAYRTIVADKIGATFILASFLQKVIVYVWRFHHYSINSSV